MSLRFTVVPASTGAGRATIRSLLSSKIPLTVHGIYRDVSKSPAEFTSYPNFTASTGDVSSGEGLDVSGSDAVLYVPPPPVSGTDLDEFSNRTAHHVKEALAEASVKRLVLISSMGSQYDREIVRSLHVLVKSRS
jgi:putative NADH-flavin reductase